jgi:hypothetical protein
MKKYSVIFALLLMFVSSSLRSHPLEVFSHSFMLTRPASYNIAMDQALWHNFVYSKEGPLYGAFQLIAFFQHSRPSDKVARYFLINGKNRLLVSGDANTDLLFTRDIRAEWVNLPSDFKGKLSLCPEQEQLGFSLTYNQDLRKFFDIMFLRDWSFGVEIPVMLVENNINFRQCDMSGTPTGDAVKTIFQAFNQPDWCYGKIPVGKQDKFGIEKIRFTLGRSLMDENYFQLASQLSMDIPLNKAQNPEFMFSPVIGMNKHYALGGAIFMQILLNRDPSGIAWTFFANLDGNFYYRNEQYRTYDLKEKPWSRYMKYVRQNSPPGTTIPGVNILTIQSVVRPYGFADFSMGWRIYTGPFEFEVGYDAWGYGGEKVHPRSPLQSPFNMPHGGLNLFGIAGAGTIIVQGQPVAASASKSTIATQAPDDLEFQTIDENDLDLNSAAASSVLNQKLHMSFGIQHIGDQTEGFADFGFFFEWPHKNSSLATYGLWFKLGGSF